MMINVLINQVLNSVRPIRTSRYATIRALKAAVRPPTFGSWNNYVSRVELSLPVKPTARHGSRGLLCAIARRARFRAPIS